MYYKKRSLLWISVICFMLSCASSCGIRPPAVTIAKKQLPAQYESIKDTANTVSSVSMNWRSFYNDEVLTTLIEKAISRNPDLRIVLQSIEMSRAQLLVAKNTLLPSVQGGLQANADRFGKYTMNGVGNFDTNLSPDISKDQRIPVAPYSEIFLGFRSSWEIDVWKKLDNRRKAAAAKLSLTQEEKNLITSMLVSEVADLYYSLLALDYEIEVLNNNIKLQQDELELIKIQKQAGRATELAVKQFSAQLYNTKSLEYQIRQDITERENKLRILLGDYPGIVNRKANIMQQLTPQLVQTGVPAEMLLNRPDIRMAEWQLVMQQANLESARAAFLPAITLNSYFGLSAFNPRLMFDPASIAAGALGGIMAPVFMQKQISAAYDISKAQNQMAYLEYEKLLLKSMQEVVTNLKGIENMQQALQNKTEAVKELKAGVAVARDLFNNGYANYLEIITAQRSVLDAELELVIYKWRIMQYIVDLYRALGGGWQ